MAIFWPNPDQMDRGGSRQGQSTWKGPDVPYHIPIDGKVGGGVVCKVFELYLSGHTVNIKNEQK